MAPSGGANADGPGRADRADPAAAPIPRYRMSLRERLFGSRQPPLEQLAYARQAGEPRPIMDLLGSRDPEVVEAAVRCLADLEGALTPMDLRALAYFRPKVPSGFLPDLDAVIDGARARIDPAYVPARPASVPASVPVGATAPAGSSVEAAGTGACAAFQDGRCMVGGRDTGPCDWNPHDWQHCNVIKENRRFGAVPPSPAPINWSPAAAALRASLDTGLCKAYWDGRCVVEGRDTGPCDSNPRQWQQCQVVRQNQLFGTW